MVSEEQHRQTPADEHQDDRGDEAGDEWLDAGLRNRLEVHVDAEGGHGHAEEDLRHIAAECVDETGAGGNRLQEQRADGCRGDESEHEPGECDLALATHLGDLAMALIPPDGHDDRDEHEHEHAGKLHDVRHGGRIDLTGGNRTVEAFAGCDGMGDFVE